MARMIIDPITRIEGHLRIEVELQDNKVIDAWSSGMLFRGPQPRHGDSGLVLPVTPPACPFATRRVRTHARMRD